MEEKSIAPFLVQHFKTHLLSSVVCSEILPIYNNSLFLDSCNVSNVACRCQWESEISMGMFCRLGSGVAAKLLSDVSYEYPINHLKSIYLKHTF